MTMNEFATLLGRIDDVSERLRAVELAMQGHIACEAAQVSRSARFPSWLSAAAAWAAVGLGLVFHFWR